MHFLAPCVSVAPMPARKQCRGSAGAMKWCRYLHMKLCPCTDVCPYLCVHSGSTCGSQDMYRTHSSKLVNCWCNGGRQACISTRHTCREMDIVCGGGGGGAPAPQMTKC